MGIVLWIVVGLIAGFIGGKIVNKAGEGLIRDLVLIGAFSWRIDLTTIDAGGVTGINIYSVSARWSC